MKKILLALVALSLLGAAASDAGWFSKKDKRRLPKPIDSPVLRPKLKQNHIPGHTTGEHPKQ